MARAELKKVIKRKPLAIDIYRKDKIQAVRFNSQIAEFLTQAGYPIQRILDIGMNSFIAKLNINLEKIGAEVSVRGRKPSKEKEKKKKAAQ